MIMKLIYISIIMLIFLYGCTGAAREHVRGYSCKEFADTFFQKNHKVMIATFGEYDIDKQYAIYICGNQYIHPPMIHLAEPFAKGGEKIVAFLKDRLLETNDDLTIRDIVSVFSEMSRQEKFNVSNDSDLMQLMNAKITSMSNQNWREMAEKKLNEIRRESSGRP